MGDDDLRGGDGNDTAIFSGSTRATVDLRLQGQPQNTGYGFDTLTGIENLVGGAGDDVFWGTDAANLLAGSGGNDILWGGGGDDTLDGGTGTDTAVFSVRQAITRSRQTPRRASVRASKARTWCAMCASSSSPTA